MMTQVLLEISPGALVLYRVPDASAVRLTSVYLGSGWWLFGDCRIEHHPFRVRRLLDLLAHTNSRFTLIP